MDKLKTISLSLLPFLYASPVYAQSGLGLSQPPGYKITNIGAVVTSAIGLALIIAGILVFVFLIWGGIQWIMSGGDKAKTEEARSRITAALVGLAIVACAWAIMQLIKYFFGLDLENPEIVKPYS